MKHWREMGYMLTSTWSLNYCLSILEHSKSDVNYQQSMQF